MILQRIDDYAIAMIPDVSDFPDGADLTAVSNESMRDLRNRHCQL